MEVTTGRAKAIKKEEIVAFDPYQYRSDFPILKEKVHGKPLIYLDNAASTQKPVQVIDTIRDYYLQYNSNVHRAIHALGERATEAFTKQQDDYSYKITHAFSESLTAIFITSAVTMAMAAVIVFTLKERELSRAPAGATPGEA